jgi:esterase/lipase superfamily enzyme
MEAYLDKISSTTGRYEVKLMHESAVDVSVEKGLFSRKWYNEDIYAALESDKKYQLNQNDFLKVTVYEDEKMILCYGGCIKAEYAETP